MISVNAIDVTFGANSLLENVSFIINRSEKVALTGKNGAGKSTLMKIIAGLQSPSKGNIGVQNDISIGYLPQQMPVSDTTTLLEETKKAFSEYEDRRNELDRLNREISEATDFDSPEYLKKLEKIDFLNHILNSSASINMMAEIERTLTGLGFRKSDFQRPTAEFSGGWRMRVELAKILLRNPDILLLDEPTNHLDIESIQWLEQFLKQKNKTLLLVSHDRAFLDNVTTRTIEINCGKIYDYKVNYSQFVTLRKERLEQQKRAYDNQQKQIAEIKEFIERFRYKATKAVQVQSRIKQLEKIVPIKIDETDTSRISLSFPPALRSSDYPLILHNVSKNYGELNVFKDVDFTIKRGEKIAFVGKNGEGKSTLVKCIMDQVDFNGELKIGHNVKIGYFAQNEAQLLDESLTVFETLDNVAVGDIRTRLKDILGAFLFRGDDIDKKVKVLSGGEKTRLAMIKLLLQPANLIIMDEPTNHLDMTSKEILKEALRKFDGTLILVSHDRDFLDGIVEKVYEFGDKKVTEHLGSIYEFLQKKGFDDFKELELKASPVSPQKNSDELSPKQSSKESYLQQKEKEKERRKLEKNVEKAEEKIELLEEKIKSIEQLIASGDSSQQTLGEYASLRDELEETMKFWEETQTKLMEFEN